MASTRRICRKRKISFSQQSSTYFTEEIIVQILSNLPVKSLLRFKSVSKPWCSLISSEGFMRTHLQLLNKRTNFTDYTIMITNSFNLKYYSGIPSSLVPVSFPYKPCTYEFGPPPSVDNPTRVKSSYLLGCCNGLSCSLLLREERKEFLIWNPSTRKSTTIHEDIESDSDWTSYDIFGFGFDESRDEYKVLLGVRLYNAAYDQSEHYVNLYGLKSKTWKRIDHPRAGRSIADGESYDTYLRRTGTFVDGKLQRLISSDENKFDMVSFDMITEMYKVVEQPDFLDWHITNRMGVLSGCLCLLSGDPNTKKDVWILKNECWEKVMTIPYCMKWSVFLQTSQGLKPVCINSDGRIVFAYGNSFFCYDPKRINSRPRRIIKCAKFRDLNVCAQSLVSPFM